MSGYTRSFNAFQTDIFLIRFDSLVHGSGQYIGLDEKIKKNDFSFSTYPNPFNKNLLIKVSKDEVIDRVEIIDLTGKIIEQKSVEGKDTYISASDKAAGIYLVHLASDEMHFKPLKLVVE